MHKQIHLILKTSLICMLLFLVACGAESEDPASGNDANATAETDDGISVISEATIEAVSVPTQQGDVVAFTVTGTLPDGCTSISEVNTSRDDDTFYVDILTVRQIDALCTQALVDFEETVEIDVAGVENGVYSVDVHGVTQPFELTGGQPADEQGVASIEPTAGLPGTIVQLSVEQLPPNISVDIGIGPVDSEYEVVASAETDANGQLQTEVAFPDDILPGQEWVAVVIVNSIETVSNPFRVEEGISPIEQAALYMIAPGDDGQMGEAIGCGDSLVAIAPPLALMGTTDEELLNEIYPLLLSAEPAAWDRVDVMNPLTASNLTLDSATIDGTTARIALSGELALAGECDNPRVEAQLTETALQFESVEQVEITINGESLESVLDLSG